ncbi:MAG TPA: hypothetical protein VGU25_02355 [Acidobacteriaceae bacterium]|nr:hypothetical protein [Acidobacteriaceae bacterium]
MPRGNRVLARTESTRATRGATGLGALCRQQHRQRQYLRQDGYEWIGRNIPRADAHWTGSLLGQLSHQQLVDAFRAGSFTSEETNEYVAVLEQRIARLKEL